MAPSSFGGLSDLTARVMLQLMFVVGFTIAPSYGVCTFPTSWTGTWFQSGMPQTMEVNATHIESKGQCVQTESQDKFVLYDRSDDCYRCLVIHEKHDSVLQYKETYCSPKETLPGLCDTIGGDAQLYSMFRKHPPPNPQPCPFRQAPFRFTYSRGAEECSNPPSRAESCTDDSRLLLRYQACPDVSGTESNVEELVCLATWKEGSTRYLVGQILQVNRRNSIISDEDSYRCFVYKGTRGPNNRMSYNIAQSGDATCNALTSPTDGSRTITLETTDEHHKRCHFPSWITEHHKWQTLDKTSSYHFTQKNATLRISKGDAAPEETRITCHSILEQPSSMKKIQIVAQYTKGCDSGHMCMTFYRRDGDVLEVVTSSDTADSPDGACSQPNGPTVTLLAASPKPARCPMFGRYTIQQINSRNRRQNIGVDRDSKECLNKDYESLEIGCGNNQDMMEFKSSCSTNSMTCHGSWYDDKKNGYAVLTPIQRSHGQPTAYCLVYSSPDNSTGSWSMSLLESTCERSQLKTPHTSYNLTLNGTCAQSSQFNSRAADLKINLYILALSLVNAFCLYKIYVR